MKNFDQNLENIKDRANLAWTLMKLFEKEWNNLSPINQGTCSRTFYHQVWDAPKLHTGLISLEATKIEKPKKPTPDHWTVPQFTGYMILQHPDIFLVDKELFVKLFIFSCQCIWVTKDQNGALSKYTSKSEKTIKCTFDERYRKENIQLFVKGGGKLDLDEYYNSLNPPAEYLEMQQKYIS